jgi:hypothetical protein
MRHMDEVSVSGGVGVVWRINISASFSPDNICTFPFLVVKWVPATPAVDPINL